MRPARPMNLFMKSVATITAIYREISYPQFSPARTTFWFKVPTFGNILLLLTYLCFILALEFFQNDIPGAQHHTSISVRAAWLAVAQVPLLILLAGKNNLIGFLTGVSYERLNILHRWVARGLLLLATIHFASESVGWDEYGLLKLEWATDTCPPTGISVYAILLWINLSTLAPLRNFFYEFFVIQHLITFFGFIIAIMMHIPSTALYARVYIYIPIGLYFVDRLIRTSRFAYNNLQPGHATLEAMEGGVTKIRLCNKHVKKWAPGSFVLLSIPKFGPGQSHPATIASIPTSHNNDLVFILKSHKGFTKRMMESAMSSTVSLVPDTKDEATRRQVKHRALVDGPYGGLHADFAAFDTVVLISGSTGVTFTISQFLDIAHRASSQKLPVRRLEFIWMIKNISWTSWIEDELLSAFKNVEAAGIEVAIKIFVTCDEAFTDSSNGSKNGGCSCDESLGPCCCTSIGDPGQADSIKQARIDGDLEGNKGEMYSKVISESSSLASGNARNGNTLSCATFQSGRPSWHLLLSDLANQAEGEMGVAVCGPMGLATSVRRMIARISDERAVHKGTGAQGICLHVESFCW